MFHQSYPELNLEFDEGLAPVASAVPACFSFGWGGGCHLWNFISVVESKILTLA